MTTLHRNSINILKFAVSSKNVRNNIIDVLKANCSGEFFTNDLCTHLREFKRHSLDVYSEIIFTLPKNIKIIIVTSLMDGDRLSYNIPILPSRPDPHFQKKRWWKIK